MTWIKNLILKEPLVDFVIKDQIISNTYLIK